MSESRREEALSVARTWAYRSSVICMCWLELAREKSARCINTTKYRLRCRGLAYPEEISWETISFTNHTPRKKKTQRTSCSQQRGAEVLAAPGHPNPAAVAGAEQRAGAIPAGMDSARPRWGLLAEPGDQLSLAELLLDLHPLPPRPQSRKHLSLKSQTAMDHPPFQHQKQPQLHPARYLPYTMCQAALALSLWL